MVVHVTHDKACESSAQAQRAKPSIELSIVRQDLTESPRGVPTRCGMVELA